MKTAMFSILCFGLAIACSLPDAIGQTNDQLLNRQIVSGLGQMRYRATTLKR